MVSISEAIADNRLVVRKEIIEGKLEVEKFGLGYSSFLEELEGNNFDVSSFFERTYFTMNIQELIEKIFNRLSGKDGGTPIHVLDTTFGGGKTHTIISVHLCFGKIHESKGNAEIARILGSVDEEFNPIVIGIDGQNTPVPINGSRPQTLWGEIAHKLAQYELIREFDEQQRPPGLSTIKEMLKVNRPVLLLLDELVVHLKKAKSIKIGKSDLGSQTILFLHSLSVAVKELHNTSMILTLSAGEDVYNQEALEVTKIIQNVKSVATRISEVSTPIKEEEIFDVVKKQLFERIDDKLKEENSEKIYRLQKKYTEYLPTTVDSADEKERLKRAFPFHPNLIGTLYERIGTIPGFQQARGVLRLLTFIVEEVYQQAKEQKFNDTFISIANINFQNPRILNELTSNLNKPQLANSVNSDLIGEKGKARLLDEELMQKNKEFPNIHTRIATAIYLYSLIGTTDEQSIGGTPVEINYAISSTEGYNLSNLQTYLETLENKLWYLIRKGAKYSIGTEASPIKIIEEEAQNITEQDVIDRARKELVRIFNKTQEIKHFIFTEVPTTTPKDRLSIILVPWNQITINSTSDPIPEKLKKMLTETPTGTPKSHRNYMFAIIPQKYQVEDLRQKIKHLIATDNLRKRNNIEKETQDKIEEIGNKYKANVDHSLILTFCIVGYVERGNVKIKAIQQELKANKLNDVIFEGLINGRLIYTKINPDIIGDKVMTGDTIPQTIKELKERFANDTHLPTPRKSNVIMEAIRKSIDSGGIGLLTSEHRNSPSEINHENYEKIKSSFRFRNRGSEPLNDKFYIITKTEAIQIHNKLNQIVENLCKDCRKPSPCNCKMNADLQPLGVSNKFTEEFTQTKPKLHTKVLTLKKFEEMEIHSGKEIVSFSHTSNNITRKIFGDIVSSLSRAKIRLRELKVRMKIEGKRKNTKFLTIFLSDLEMGDAYQITEGVHNSFTKIKSGEEISIEIVVEDFNNMRLDKLTLAAFAKLCKTGNQFELKVKEEV